jgi:twitching motility protein PilT
MYTQIQTGGKFGMVTLENSLKALYETKQISLEDAVAKTSRPDDFMKLIGAAPAGITR